MASVKLEKLLKRYDKTQVLHSIDLDVSDGEFVVLVGPSGCGKSTTLRMLAGLEEVTGGQIFIDDVLVNNLEPKDRNIAMVFQNYAIYPHMSVRKNIGFGLRASKLPKAEKKQRIDEIAKLLDMTDLLDRKPSQLSGGQRQRVAIGRAMVRDPAVFLFDEPLSNLDAQLRTQMRIEIKKLHQRVGTTIIFVTHDQIEAMTMADRIVVMKDGHIQQIGTPYEVFHEPANMFVAQFIGAPPMNMLPGKLSNGEIVLDNGSSVKLPASLDTSSLSESDKMFLGLRPNDLIVSNDERFFEGQVTVLEPLGSETLVYVTVNDQELVATAPGRHPPKPGVTVGLSSQPESRHFFNAASGKTLLSNSPE